MIKGTGVVKSSLPGKRAGNNSNFKDLVLTRCLHSKFPFVHDG